MEAANEFGILPYVPVSLGALEESAPFQACVKEWGQPCDIYRYSCPLPNVTQPAFYIVRWETPSGKHIRPFSAEGSLRHRIWKWVSSLPSSKRPLWNWEGLEKSTSVFEPVLVVEGEKTAQAAQRMFPSWIVVTSAGGSSAARHSAWPLMHRQVIIMCDYDQPGMQYADMVADLAIKAGASAVLSLGWDPFIQWKIENGERVSRSGGVPEGYDLADLEAEGWTYDHLRDCEEEGCEWLRPYPLSDDSWEEMGDLSAPTEGETVPYPVHRAGPLISSRLPPRDFLLGTWLASKSSNMIYAARGVGKSFLALNIALAVAQGRSFLTWRGGSPCDVLYVDGEMIDLAWQERLKGLGVTAHSPYINNLGFITYDSLPLEPGRRIPDLGNADDRRRICASLCPTTRLLVLDNISSLTMGVDENDGKAWEPIAEWAEYLKHQYGVAILFVHHAGKTGEQRGISKREDAMDTVIALKRPSDYHPSEGARFDIEFTKGRTVSSQEMRGLQVHLKEGHWTMVDAITQQRMGLKEMYDAGATISHISQALNLSHRQVYRWVQEQLDMGLIKKRVGKNL